MYLRSFTESGLANITMSVDELNALCNELHEYFEVYKPEKIDKRLYEIRRKLYIFYEVIHHGCCFDETTMHILEKMKEGKDEICTYKHTSEMV